MTPRQLGERTFAIVESIVTACLVPWYVLRARWGRVAVPVLMYHQITDDRRGITIADDCVSPARFAEQMRAIGRAGYRVISLRELVEALDAGSLSHLRRTVVITFDDGFVDQHRRALPVLEHLGFTATVFAITGYIGHRGPLPHLAPAEGSSEVPHEGWWPADWPALRDMTRRNVTVASHGVSHRSLGVLDAGAVAMEVAESRRQLERELAAPVQAFAYPFGSQVYGDFNDGTREALRRAGYRAACTTVIGRNAAGTDPFTLRRLPVEERDGAFRLRCKLAGAYDWVRWVKTAWQALAPREDRVNAAPAPAWLSQKASGS